MVKTMNLPDVVYSDLLAISEELTAMAKKPISIAMAMYLITAVYRAHMSEPCALDAFRQRLVSLDIMSPEEFEREWNDIPPKKQKRQGK
jgi:hypothetical protein